MAQRTQNMLVYSIHVSQSSVATRFGCGGIFNDSAIPNWPVKEFCKSVENWQSYWSSLDYYFLGHDGCSL